MKDIKHIRRDFHSVARGRTCGYRGGWGVKTIFPQIQPDSACELVTSMAHATAQFLGPCLLGPWGGAKRSNIIKS